MKKCKCCGATLTPVQRKFRKGDIVKISPFFYKINTGANWGKTSIYKVVGWNGPLSVRVVGGKSLKSTTRHSFNLDFLRVVKKAKP